MTSSKENWIKAGYETFAVSGESGLKIEQLSEKTGISKSSFYHHFATLEIFIRELLDYHLQQAAIISDKENSAKNIDPELIHILTSHKYDLLFSRQLRFNREKEIYHKTITRSDEIIGQGFLSLWAKELNHDFSEQQLSAFIELGLSSFYLQINETNISHDWLREYFEDLKQAAGKFI